MTTNVNTPAPITLSPANTKFLKEPDSDGRLQYLVNTGRDRIILSCLFSRERILDSLYNDCIDRICDAQSHIGRRIVQEIVSRSLSGYDRWPDAENFTQWAINKCTSAYFLQNFLLKFLDDIDRVFRTIPQHLDCSSVEFLADLCEGEGLAEILQGDPTPAEIESRLIARARAVVTAIHLEQRHAPLMLSLNPSENSEGEMIDDGEGGLLGLTADLQGTALPVRPILSKARQWNGHNERTTKPEFARKIRGKGRKKKITVREQADAWISIFWLKNRPLTKMQIRKAGLERGFGVKRIDGALKRIGGSEQDGFIELPLAAVVQAQALRDKMPSTVEQAAGVEDWRRPLPVTLSEEPVENDFCDVIGEG